MRLVDCIKQPVLVGMSMSLLFMLWLALWLFSSAETDLKKQEQDRMALIQANALADTIGNNEEARFANIIHGWTEQDKSVIAIRVVRLSGAQLLASNFPNEDAPRRLNRDEKSLFDLANQIRAAIDTNQGEGVFRKKQITIEPLHGDAFSGQVLITVPYQSNGQFAGIIQLASKTQGIETQPILADMLLLLFIVIATALAICSIMRLRDQKEPRLSISIAIGLFVLFTLLFHGKRMEQLEQLFIESNHNVAAHLQAVQDLSNRISGMAPTLDAAQPSSWDTDHYQRPNGLISQTGDILSGNLDSYFDQFTYFLDRSLWAAELLGLGILLFFILGYASRMLATIKEHFHAYLYVTPAILGMLLLVFFPFAYGVALSFTDTTLFNEYLPFSERWVGWENYLSILGDFNIFSRTADGLVWNYQNFYWTLMITILWTVTNVTVGVTVGFALAMTLNIEGLQGKAIYRVLLILPWAIPNYITALVWRGMFHPQFGVINQFVQMLGFEPIAWFDDVVSSFLTGLATNGWLSFPFMMVIILGALQSIPRDMYEAAEVEGANRWQKLRHITLPALKPTLIPAIVLSVVWTFNMFNIIFLVSGGEPAGANEILITKAYKLAFENYQYAYAAAYSMVIFMILLVYGVFQTRITKATESF